ncbi:hypothetical protein QR680_018308 [Steinernema hermaphroditum]|uniref:Ionotropic glutamate receptor C-terminal domain-containing protein n=1 Tax=Steinernema hermaphroditum TaxID=289476 RepID=A0AA39HIU1_9BILA|nr:hypothetical protein QR680_018308 [Steinernema hermaphroditum]
MDDWIGLDFSVLRGIRAPHRTLRVGAFDFDPDAINCFRNLPSRPCSRPGAHIEIISMVLEMLGWNWTMVDLGAEYGIERTDFGELQTNGSFTGVMGLLQSEKIDIFGLAMRITPSRLRAAAFSYPILINTQVYIAEASKGVDFRYFMFSVVSLNVWLVILFAIIILSGIQTVISVFEDTYKKSFFENSTRAAMVSIVADSRARETLGMFLRQRGSNPRSHTEMVLQGGVLLAMVVTYVYYQSAMNSKLTAPSKPVVPFRTQSQLFDLMDQNKAHLFYPVNATMECSNKENCEREPGVLQRNPLRVVPDDEATSRREFESGGVYIATHDIDLLPFEVSWYDRKEKTIMIKDPNGLHFYMGFAFSLKNAIYKNVFNRALIKILPGIPRIMMGPGYHNFKRNYFSTMKMRKQTLTFQNHLQQLFLTFSIGCAISIAAFLLELLVHRSGINAIVSRKFDEKISGVYFRGVRKLSWFPGYSNPNADRVQLSKYENCSNMGDNLTQIQDLVNDLANLLCNSIGVLQAVAPPVTVGEETEVIQREQQSQHFAHGIAQVTRDIDAVVDSLDLDGAEDRETAEKRIAELEQQRAESVKDLEKVTSQAEAMLEKITSRLGDIAEVQLESRPSA